MLPRRSLKLSPGLLRGAVVLVAVVVVPRFSAWAEGDLKREVRVWEVLVPSLRKSRSSSRKLAGEEWGLGGSDSASASAWSGREVERQRH